MRKLALLFLLKLSTYAIGQNCFFPFQDQFGNRFATDVLTIEQMACKMRDSLPERFRDDFGVFDFSYYHLNEFMPDAYNLIWNQEIQKAKNQKLFYLFVGRIYSNNSSNNRVKVELAFPQMEEFDCVTNEQIQFLEHQIAILGSNNITTSITKIYSDALKQLTDFIAEKKICCNTGNRSSCGNCIEDEAFSSYLKGLGYSELEVNFTEAINYIDTSSNVKEFAKLSFNINNSVVNINNDIKDLVNELGELTDNISAEICLYDNNNCSNTFKVIESSNSNNSTLYFKVKVIGLNSMVNHKVYIKLESNIFLGKGSGTLFVKSFDPNFSTSQIIESAKYFTKLAGVKVGLKPVTKNLKVGDTDGFVFVGKNRSKIKSFIFNSIIVQPLLNLNTCDETSSITDWLDNPTNAKEFPNPERSPGKFILVATDAHLTETIDSYTNSQDENKLLVTGGKLRLIGFLILHGTSHIGGFEHSSSISYMEGKGYASNGNWLANNCLDCDNTDDPRITFEEIIKETKKDFPYIINQTNAVFGY